MNPLVPKPAHAATLALALLAWLRPGAAATPDYVLLDDALLRNVRDGFVDYDGIARDPAFEQFTGQLGRAGELPAEARTERLALLINAYNAFAIQAVLDGYSPAKAGARRKFFGQRTHALQGREASLDEIRADALEAARDPRLYFAVVCAALACPRLASEAYTPESLDSQLDRAARRFINDRTRNRFELTQGRAFLSPVFDWYRGDFEAAGGSLQRYLADFVEDPALAAALRAEQLEVRILVEDWQLNGLWSGPAAD